MAIENRDLTAGTILVGRYKRTTYRCTVLEVDGRKAYSLEDGSIHNSPSAAASKLMKGGAVNGWRWWTAEADFVDKPPKPLKATTATTSVATKLMRVIKRIPNQKGVDEGFTKWHCSACMESFVAEGTTLPAACPKGHAAESADELAGAPKEAEAAE